MKSSERKIDDHSRSKQVRIVDFLAQLGHHAQHIKSEQYWYFSPLRNERTPSFKVNDRINEWYDFGEATGGDLVELAKYICRTDCVSEALAYIERLVNGASLPRTRMPTAPPRPVEAEMKDVIVIPLRHHALFSYLQSRLIDADIGRMYCKEVHYELRGRHYFALAFGNTSGGYEVRNAYYKGCLNNKDISLIRHLTEETQENVCVFEGFMDFLSYMTLKLAGDRTVCLAMPCDYLVMNSVNNLKRRWHVYRNIRSSTVISTMTLPGREPQRPLPGCMMDVSAMNPATMRNTKT